MSDRRSVFTKHEKKALADLALEYAPKVQTSGVPLCFRQTRNGETIEILIGDAAKNEGSKSSTWGDFE